MNVKAQKNKKVKVMPPYKVFLHNDDIHSLTDAVKAIQKILHLDTDGSTKIAQEAQDKDFALMCVTHREKAELIQDQFTVLKFTVTIESEKADE